MIRFLEPVELWQGDHLKVNFHDGHMLFLIRREGVYIGVGKYGVLVDENDIANRSASSLKEIQHV